MNIAYGSDMSTPISTETYNMTDVDNQTDDYENETLTPIIPRQSDAALFHNPPLVVIIAFSILLSFIAIILAYFYGYQIHKNSLEKNRADTKIKIIDKKSDANTKVAEDARDNVDAKK